MSKVQVSGVLDQQHAVMLLDTLNRAANMAIEHCFGSHTLIVPESVDRFCMCHTPAARSQSVWHLRCLSDVDSGAYPLNPRFFSSPAWHSN